ncbi:hypothetical protein AGDE_16070 [Angomonas deanei]|nr:hypothetical protein AGDE_16070 [Angomonas deanei]|eukprot:EPY17784.1 hypothetical protein AGDE_16070 [Angomonas deanei]
MTEANSVLPKKSFWESTMSSLAALANIATCKAEMDWQQVNNKITDLATGGVDDEGDEMTTTSSYHKEKELLMAKVNELWTTLEQEGLRLENVYRGIFFRGMKEKLSQNLDTFINKAGSMSVVFDP